MKKVLLLLLTLMLCVSSLTAFASDTSFYTEGEYPFGGYINGIGSVTKAEEYDTTFKVEIDCNSEIVLTSPTDALSIMGTEDKGDERYSYYIGEETSDGVTCDVIYTKGVRTDSDDITLNDVDLENEVEYMQEGATIRFNQPGSYYITIILGATDGYERLYHLIEHEEDGNVYYTSPHIELWVEVSESTEEVPELDYSPHDEELITVEGITSYVYDRVIFHEGDIIALCSAPLKITVNTDLANLVITKLTYDGNAWGEEYFVDFGVEPDPNTWFTPAKKGTVIVLDEPGLYDIWAEKDSKHFTGIFCEIGSSTAIYTSSKVLVNGKEVKFEAYNINGNNYFKLRDIAYVLSENKTGVVFDVAWDGLRNKITMTTGQFYKTAGGELAAGDGKDKKYQRSTNEMVKDGMDVSLDAYLINGNNYFKLRDLGKLFDFSVSWDGTNNCILIDTTTGYIEE